MGNRASSVAVNARAPAMARLVGPHGDVRLIETPVSVAEVMMEAPGHVVASAKEILGTRRVSGMRADEELRPGGVYVLLPVDKVGSRLSDGQMDMVLEAVAKKKSKSKSKSKENRRVSPDVGDQEEEIAGAKGGEEVVLASFAAGKRVGGRRPWRPSLDTIHETRSI